MTVSMNTHELFKTVEAHLLRQGKQANDGNGRCFYRGPQNTKCAVGFLIKDEFYQRGFEGAGVTCPEVRIAVEKSIGRTLEFKEVVMLKKLQNIHDNVAVYDWYESLKRLEREEFRQANLTVCYKPEKYPPTADQMFEDLKFITSPWYEKPIKSKSIFEFISA